MVNLKDWQEINIGNDTTLKARIGWQGLTTSEYKDSGEYYLVTGTDFENGLVNWDTCHFVDKWRFDQDKNIQLKVNDVLITKDGTIGKAGFIDTIKLPTTLNSGVFVIRTNSNKLDQKYLYYIFTSEIFVEFLNRLTAGSTINHLYQKDFIHFTFKAPKLEEQKAIAKTLSDTDELINSLEKLISKKEAIKQGSMQQILTGKKRLSGFTGEWEEKKLADICEIKKGEQLNKQYLNYTDPFPVINGGIEPSGYTNKYNSEPNTITISEGGNSCGFVNFISTNFWLGGHCYSINNFNLEITFFYQLLKNFENKIMGLRLGSGLPNIQKKALLDFRINIPKKIDEQQAIAQILSDMDKEIESLKSKLSKTKAIKDGIMSELLTGKTRLKVKDE